MHTSRGSLALTEGWGVLPLWFVQHTGSMLRWYWFSHGHVILGSQERHWQALCGAFMFTYGNNRSSMIFLDLHNDDLTRQHYYDCVTTVFILNLMTQHPVEIHGHPGALLSWCPHVLQIHCFLRKFDVPWMKDYAFIVEGLCFHSHCHVAIKRFLQSLHSLTR